VFAGGCTIQTAASVLRGGAPDSPLEDDLISLLDKRLLREDARARHRFVMLATLRAYATERLQTESDADEVRRRHAAHFLAYAESAASSALEVELDNLAAALRHFVGRRETEEALRLAGLLGQFWWSRDFAEGWQRLSEVLALPAPERLRRSRAEVLLTAGRLAIRLGKLDEAAAVFDESLRIAGQEDDARLQAKALADRALVYMERAEFDDARPLLERALAAQRERPDGEGLADTLDSLGVLATGIGDYDVAEQRLNESLTLYPDEIGAAWVHNDLACLALARDDLRLAEDHAEQALATGQDRTDLAVVAWARNYLGLVASCRGEFARAREHHEESLKLVLLLGDRRPQALALEGFAALAVEEGAPRRALQLAVAAEARRAEAGIPRTVAESAILDRRLDRARAALGPDADAASAAARTMSLDEAVALARAE
jgi:tetratricopeptide (TPR) repeat protein